MLAFFFHAPLCILYLFGFDVFYFISASNFFSFLAPTYFSIYQGYVDGGVFANNPSMVSLARSVSAFPMSVGAHLTCTLSIGTGSNNYAVHGRHHDWGILPWGQHLISLLFDATETSIQLNMRMLQQERYHRLNSELPEFVALDDTSRLDDLIAFADIVDISDAVKFIRSEIVEATREIA